MTGGTSRFVSRAGEKLSAALGAFGVDVSNAVCADFGCNVGGFTDCLLQRGAERVYAVDSGYGTLAWTLRRDDRVVVMERTNVLYCPCPEPVDLVVVDVAWTPQARAIPAAMRWLKPPAGRIVSLLKPHYEQAKAPGRTRARGRGRRADRRMDDARAESICLDVCRRLAGGDCRVDAVMRSPLRGKGGNVEFLVLLEALPSPGRSVSAGGQTSVDGPSEAK